MTRTLTTGALLAALATGIGACGSTKPTAGPAAPSRVVGAGTGDEQTRTSNGPATGRTSHLRLGVDPSGAARFDKKTLRARAGKVVITLTTVNHGGGSPHNVAIKDNGVFVASPTAIDGKVRVTSTLKPGNYTFFCSVDGHERFGMHGTLTVTR